MKPRIDRSEFEFVQDGNTLGSTPEVESIKIRLERQLPGDPPFIVIETTGWSIDDVGELTDLIEECLPKTRKKK